MKSRMIASNKAFDEWREVLGDEVIASALLNRLLYNCHVVNIQRKAIKRGKIRTCFEGIQTRQGTRDHQGQKCQVLVAVGSVNDGRKSE